MKEFLRLLTRFSQQTGQNCILDPLRKNCQEFFLEKNASSIVSRTLRWKFIDFRQKFQQGCQNCVSDVRRKTVRIVPDKGRYSCIFQKLSKLFSRIFANVFQQFVKTAEFWPHREKHRWKYSFFLKKLIFFIFSNILSKISGLSTNFFHQGCQTCLFNVQTNFAPSKLDFLLKEFYFTLFRESARTAIGPSTNFFSVGTSKLRSRCPEHISEEKFFEKRFLKVF